MVLTLVPVAAVAPETSVEDEDARVLGLALVEVAEVALLEDGGSRLVVDSNEALAVGCLVLLVAEVDRAVLQVVAELSVIFDEFLDSFQSLLVSLSLDDLKVKLRRCLCPLYLLDRLRCLLLDSLLRVKLLLRLVQRLCLRLYGARLL